MTSNKEIDPKRVPHAAVVNNSNDEYSVVLPCDVKDFKRFVSSLLGSHQVSEGVIKGSFDVSTREIENFYHLVHQRVSKQNDATLMHLGITVQYDDGTSVTHNNLADFNQYYPTDPCYPVGVSLKFSYLIVFQDKSAPEKQEIDVAIIADADKWKDERISDYYSDGVFSYRIAHTERTWATDIAGLLKNHAKTFMNENDTYAKVFSISTHEFSSHLGTFVVGASILFWAAHTTEMIEKLAIKQLAEYYTWSAVSLIILGLMIYSIRTYTDYNLYIKKTSFIVLTDKDDVHRSKEKKKDRKKWLKYALSWTTTIGLGVVANVFYHYLPL